MEAVGKFLHLHLQEVPGSNDYFQPRAPYVLTEKEKLELLALISRTRVPSDYSSTLIKHAGEGSQGDHHKSGSLVPAHLCKSDRSEQDKRAGVFCCGDNLSPGIELPPGSL
jgi:hypothetical protein